MRVVDQAVMNLLFDVTDEIELDREALQVPLAMEGDGCVRALGEGRFEVVLPDREDLAPFLEELPERLRAAGWTPGSD